MKEFFTFDEVVDRIYALLEAQRIKQIEIDKLEEEYNKNNEELEKQFNLAKEIWPEGFKELMTVIPQK